MVAVVERDRRLARRLVAALQAQGCTCKVAHGYKQGMALLTSERPEALYVSEVLQRASGGDLLAEFDRDRRLAELPAMVRVSRQDSVFARAMRRGGLQTVVAPVDVDAAAARLSRMARGEEGVLRRLVTQSRELHAHARANRAGFESNVARTRRLRGELRRKD
jgi:DNA-binding NtrC family response regulator